MGAHRTSRRGRPGTRPPRTAGVDCPVSIDCIHKVAHGPQFCVADCPVSAPCGAFRYARVEHPEAVPPADPRVVDVALLDMNHGWPNLGHDSLVHLVQDTACDLQGMLEASGLALRVISFDVRRHALLPEGPGGRFAVYLGSGGPGHIDPRRNDGVSPGTQGIVEDPRWEEPCFALLDALQAHPQAALLAVCHTFGIMCRWSGIAEPTLRGPEKGGKSAGVLENLLTPEAHQHPWFRRFANELPDGRRLRVLDNRLYDLLPTGRWATGLVAIGHETQGPGGPEGDALTMVEWARDPGGVMPRIFAVNHHPEIVDRERQELILERKLLTGAVDRAWYEERHAALKHTHTDEEREERLRVTSDYTLVAPLRFHLFRALRQRAEALGVPAPAHEEQVLESHPAELQAAGS